MLGYEAPPELPSEKFVITSVAALERDEAAEASKLLKSVQRVEYTGNGMTGTLLEMNIGKDERGPIFSSVLFDGREAPNLVKTKYLKPSDSLPENREELSVLDELEESLPIEEFCGDKQPYLRRCLVVATIHQARATERVAGALERLANHLGAK